MLYGPPVSSETEQTPFNLPDLRELLMSVLGDAVHTVIMPTALGLEARIVDSVGAPQKSAEFSLGRLSALSSTSGETAEIVVKLVRALMQCNPTFRGTSYGLNYEFEFRLEKLHDSAAWLAERFVRPAVKLQKGWAVNRAEVVKFSVAGPDGLRRNINLQPRAGKAHYFYAHVNNHVSALGDLKPLDVNRWRDELDRECEITTQFLVGLLGSGHATRKRKNASKRSKQ